MKIWSVNYVLHFGSVKIHKHCLYWNVFSTDIDGKITFNCLLLFKPFLLVSKLCESSQYIPKFFSHMQKLSQFVYLRDFSIVIHGKFNSNFPVLFLAFFHLVCKLLQSLFIPFLLVSKSYELNL